MKKIWIDGYEANVPARLGSGQVAFELLKNIAKFDHQNEYTILLPSEPLDDMPKQRPGFLYRVLRPSQLWTRIALPVSLFTAKQKPDVIFSPTHYIPFLSPVKRVVTIFDLSYLFFPELFKKKDLWQLTNWTATSIKKADHIITISQKTKKDIMTRYNVNASRITVAYPGKDEEHYFPIKEKGEVLRLAEKFGITKPYLIFVGTIQPRKNLAKLIEAFAKIDNLQLVIVGKTTGDGRQGWMFEEVLELPKTLGIEDRVIFTGFLKATEVNLLMNGAICFCLPSLYEGFGIPVVDAMATGLPVIVSNVSSLPEVVGRSGLLVDPKSVDQIEQAIRIISSDKKLRVKLAKRSLERAKKFSWEKMAREVIEVLENI